MAFSPKLPNGVRRLLRLPQSRARLAREMDEEMRSHLAMRVDHLRARGMSAEDARAEALRRFGDAAEYRAYAERRGARQARRHGAIEWFGDWLQDMQYAGRQFRRNVGFTALAVLTLALGIGANTAIFTVVHRLLIAPLPYPDGNRIVKLVMGEGDRLGSPNQAALDAWVRRAHSIENIAAVRVDAFFVQDFGETQDTIPAYVTWNYLRLLGLHPAFGRAFGANEARPGAAPVAMISHGKWQREYAGRTDVLGSTVRVQDREYTIVGVMPQDIAIPMTFGSGASGNLWPPKPAIWLPVSLDSIDGAYVFAKLRPGISARQASNELQAILESEPRGNGTAVRARAMRAQDFLDPRETQTVQVLFVAVGVLLLIACANVANLLMSRAWTRRREFAVRVALGAGRGRLARQVLTESVLLALLGGALGVGVAWMTLKIIIALRPPALENLASVRVESTVLFWSAGISVVTGMLFGCAPALFAAARSVGDVLRSETRGASGGTAARRLRSTLIVLEIAMSLVLLVGAGLLVRSFVALQRMPLGFEPRGLVYVDVMMTFRRDGMGRILGRNWSLEYRAARQNEILERLRAMPGVTEASIGIMPGQGWMQLAPPGADRGANGQSRMPDTRGTFITPNFFRVARMTLAEGRVPDSLANWRFNEQPGMPTEIVVNRSLARRLWPNGRVLGARIGGRNPGESSTVVGVVEDARMPGRRTATLTMEMYQPLPARLSDAPVVLRTTLSEKDVIASIRRTVADLGREFRIASGMPVGAIAREITVGDTYLRDSLAPARFAMALLAAFSVIALVLSSVGLYGVIAYSVAQRTREIGVRVALGADARSVKRLVVGGGLRLTMLGVGLGVIAAAASTRVLASLLYGVSPVDPVSFVAIAALVVTIALVASYVPARRAVRVDPMEALRAD